MWKSWGDNFEISRYNEEKRPRKLKRVGIYILISFVLYGLSWGSITIHLKPEASFYYYFPSIIALCSVALSWGLFYLKWKKNDGECDLALIFVSFVFGFMAYIALPSTML